MLHARACTRLYRANPAEMAPATLGPSLHTCQRPVAASRKGRPLLPSSSAPASRAEGEARGASLPPPLLPPPRVPPLLLVLLLPTPFP